MKKHNPSLDQLSKSVERRSRHLMIQTLQKFEDTFPDVDNTRNGQVFKTELRNMFNDCIRAQRDELNDYEVEYRPMRITDSGTLALTQSFMRTVQKVEFGFRGEKPFLRIFSAKEYAKVLDAIRSEFGTGVLYYEDTNLVLEIVGVDACVNSVLSVMDRYSLLEQVSAKYHEWRDEVVRHYRS